MKKMANIAKHKEKIVFLGSHFLKKWVTLIFGMSCRFFSTVTVF
jgi:hypothetical protein